MIGPIDSVTWHMELIQKFLMWHNMKIVLKYINFEFIPQFDGLEIN